MGLRVAADDEVWGDEAFPPWLTPMSAIVSVAIGAVTIAGTPSEHRPIVAVLVTIAVAPCVALNWLRRPTRLQWFVGDVVTLGAVAVLNLVGPAHGWVEHDTTAGHTSMFISIWLVVESASVRPQRDSLVVLVSASAIVVLRDVLYEFDGTAIWLAGLLFAYLGGWLIHRFAVTVVQLRAAEGRLAEKAVAAEQRRIAREVHDVVAHSLSVTALHLSAARMAAERGDLPAARAAVGDAERLTRSSLADLRRTVRMLRVEHTSDVPPVVEVALPGVAETDPLVESFRAAGMRCALTVDVGGETLGELVELTAYRVVQEALTNATRHQEAASAEVAITVDNGGLAVEVRSTGPCRPRVAGGHGLIGMRERVEGLGGTLVAGPDADGWSVRAIIPIQPAAPDANSPTVPGPQPSELLR